MKNFLTILLRNQFNLFYRFGYTYIPHCQLLAFDGEINHSEKEKLINLFAETTPFEWEEEYLIIHFEKDGLGKQAIEKFQIQEIVKIYPLSSQAKSSIETRIDNRINLELPIFEDILFKIEKTIEKHELEKAIEALWNVCNIKDDLNKYISDIGLENIFNGLERRKSGTKPSKIKDGNYWEYVIAYDRYDFYPNSVLGYFYDAGQIFAYSKGLESFEGSKLYNFLQSINKSTPNLKFKDIVNLLETQEQGQSYVSQTISNEQLQYLITPLFLMLREEIRKVDDINNTILFKHLKTLKEFGSSFNYAVILLGSFFGFKKFYDVYYDHLNLRFYKSYQPKVEQKENSEIDPIVQFEVSSNENEAESKLDETLVREKEVEEKKHEATIIIEFEQPQKHAELAKEKQILNDSIQKSQIESKNLDIQPEKVKEYKTIIAEIMQENGEMKLTEIGNIIKKRTGKKVTNDMLKNIIDTMDSISCFKKLKTDFAKYKTM